MIVAAWVLVLLLLSSYFSGVLERQHNPNQQVAGVVTESGVREVRLRQNRNGHYVATGRINGHRTQFLLDTGATDVSVPEPLAERLGLLRGPAQRVQTANGAITTYATRLDHVKLGEIELYDVRAHINPYMHGGEVLLGMSFLGELDFEQRGSQLTLRQIPRLY